MSEPAKAIVDLVIPDFLDIADGNSLDCAGWKHDLAKAINAALDAAVQAERERCAKVCADVFEQAWKAWKKDADMYDQGCADAAERCEIAIRHHPSPEAEP